MKIPGPHQNFRSLREPERSGRPLIPRSKRASALLIVLVLLSVMSVLVVSNSVRLGQLKRELQLIEEKQKQKFHEPVGRTNTRQ